MSSRTTGIITMCLSIVAHAQSPSPSAMPRPWMISRVAGSYVAGFGGDGSAATNALISSPGVSCGDGAGGFLIPDQGNHIIRQVFGNGSISTVAGIAGSAGYSGEGLPALASKLSSPTGIAAVSGGYAIACRGTCRIMMLWANATLATLAGTGACGLSGEGGPATLATINPSYGGVVADPAGPGGGLVFADHGNHVIRRVLPSGTIVRVAGTGTAGYSGDFGPATSARINSCLGVSPDGLGGLYLADNGNHCVRYVSAAGIISKAAGTCGTLGYGGDGNAATQPGAFMRAPVTVAYEPGGGLFVSEQGNNVIRYVSAAGTLATVAGVVGGGGSTGDGGLATSALLSNPTIVSDGAGWWLINDINNNVIRRLTLQSATQTASATQVPSVSPSVAPRPWAIYRAAGNGSAGFSGMGGLATSAALGTPGIAVKDGSGGFYFPDQTYNVLFRAHANGTIVVAAGTAGVCGYSGESAPALSARLCAPTAVGAFGGGYLITNRGGCRVLMLWPNATLSTAAGNGACALTGDGGLASLASLYPGYGAVASDPAGPGGGWVLADQSNNAIRRVLPSGVIIRVAGTGTQGSTGDGGAATSALLNRPCGVSPDGNGNLYVADSYNFAIRLITFAGVISTVVGTLGTASFAGDGGPASVAFLVNPLTVNIESVQGGMLIAGQDNRVRYVSPLGIISTIAGTGGGGLSGDGSFATLATLANPSLGGDDGLGGWLISDANTNVVRRLTLVSASQSATLSPTPSQTPSQTPSVTFTAARLWMISLFAGNYSQGYGGDGGPATSGRLNGPGMGCSDGAGGFMIPDQGNHVLRQVLANRTIVSVAGTGVSGYSGEGLPALGSSLSFPGAVASYRGGFLITSRGSCRVMMLWPNQTLTTAAGSGACGYSGAHNGGLATQAWSVPQYGGLIADTWGGGWIMAEQGIHVVRRVLMSGIIMLVAGTGTSGSLGNGGPATSGQLNGPFDVAPDGNGGVYITDYQNHAIRFVNPGGSITVVAGSLGVAGYGGDGLPGTSSSVRINLPMGLAYQAGGGCFWSEQGNGVIRYLSGGGIVSTVVNVARSGGSTGACMIPSGDGGFALLARLNNPTLADDGMGGYMISDANNHVLRRIVLQTPTQTPMQSQTPSMTQTTTITPSVTGTATPTASTTSTPSQSQTRSVSQSPTVTRTQSGTQSAASTGTGTSTVSVTSTLSSTGTSSGVPTTSGTATGSGTCSASQTGSVTPTPTFSSTSTQSVSQRASPSSSQQGTPSPSGSQANSNSQSVSPSMSQYSTLSESGTQSSTGSEATTPSQMQSRSVSRSQSQSLTKSPLASLEPSPSASKSATHSQARSVSQSTTTSITGAIPSSSTSPSIPITLSQSPTFVLVTVSAASGVSFSASVSPACTALGVNISLAFSGGVSIAAVLEPSVGILFRLGVSCYLSVPLAATLITSVTDFTDSRRVLAQDIVNTLGGTCSSEPGTRALLRQQHDKHLGDTDQLTRSARALSGNAATNFSTVVVGLVVLVPACFVRNGSVGLSPELSVLLDNLTVAVNSSAGSSATSVVALLSAFAAAVANASGLSSSRVTAVASAGRPFQVATSSTTGISAASTNSSSSAFVVVVAATCGAITLAALIVVLVVIVLRRRALRPSAASAGSQRPSDFVNPMHGKRGPPVVSADSLRAQRLCHPGKTGTHDYHMRGASLRTESTATNPTGSGTGRIYPALGTASAGSFTRRPSSRAAALVSESAIGNGGLVMTANPMIQ